MAWVNNLSSNNIGQNLVTDNAGYGINLVKNSSDNYVWSNKTKGNAYGGARIESSTCSDNAFMMNQFDEGGISDAGANTEYQ